MKYFLCCLYTLLLMTKVLFPSFYSFAIVIMICINIFIYATDKKNYGLALCSSFLMPGEIFSTLNFLIGLLFQKNNYKRIFPSKVDKINLVLISIIIVSSLVNSLFFSAIPNLLFSFLYLCVIWFSIKMSEDIIDTSEIVKCMKASVVIEFIVTLAIVFQCRHLTPGDEFCGSMSSAHWFGNWLIVALVLFTFHDDRMLRGKLSFKSIRINIVYILLTLFMLYLADAKSLILSLVVGVIGWLFLEKRRSYKYSFEIFTIAFCLSLFVLFALLYSGFVRQIITNNFGLLAQYLYTPGWNGKFLYIKGTLLKELAGLRILTGFGIGQYGSRIANMFAYDTMWRADNSINNAVAAIFESHCIPQYAQYIKFYSADFVSQIGWRSAVMSYPFNSITAMIAETGIVGILFFSKYFNSYIKNSECKLLGYYFVVACFFDLYFDNFPCVGIIILILLNTKKRRKETCNGKCISSMLK